MIRATDRVGKVLERHPSLLEEFIGMSPEFGRLRNPHLRRVMGKLVTVGDAAKIAGIDAGELLGRLNSAIGEEADAATEQAGGEPGRTASHARDESPNGAGSTRQNEEPATLPSSANAGEDGVIVDLDVREDLRSGREPFSRIMAAVATVPPGGTLRLRATFEPVPLYAVLRRRGFEATPRQNGSDDWTVLFRREENAAAAATQVTEGAPEPAAAEPRDAPTDLSTRAPATGTAPKDEEDSSVVILDVRHLEPPEPLVRTLEALRSLPRGGTLVQLNQRVPMHLLPHLVDLGFTYEVREHDGNLVRTFIRHASDEAETLA